MPEIRGGLPHLLVSRTATTETYTTPKRAKGGGLTLPDRNRQQHAQSLFEKLTRAREESEALKQQRTALGVDAQAGIYLEFESLEVSKQGIELLSVKSIGKKTRGIKSQLAQRQFEQFCAQKKRQGELA